MRRENVLAFVAGLVVAGLVFSVVPKIRFGASHNAGTPSVETLVQGVVDSYQLGIPFIVDSCSDTGLTRDLYGLNDEIYICHFSTDRAGDAQQQAEELFGICWGLEPGLTGVDPDRPNRNSC